MFGKCIEKINNFIQWTKKWHLLHCIFIIETSLLSICIFADLPYMTLEKLGEYFLINTLYSYPIVLVIVAPLSILIALIKFIRKQPVSVESKFLLKNSTYNIIYIINLLYIFSLFLMLLIALLSFSWQDFEEMDNLMAIGFAFWLITMGIALLMATFLIYTVVLFVLTKIQKHKLIKKEHLPFR